MKAKLSHVGINLSPSSASYDFWKDLLEFLGFDIDDDGGHFHAGDGSAYLCVSLTKAPFDRAGFHRKHTGLNHIALGVSAREQVDEVVQNFVTPRGLPLLYGGARAYPEYTANYYAAFFEDPDRIKVEIVYDPPSTVDQVT
jgi:catechol 2,3-dioxygenase-like lactoylglutathione lyase family enzyme